MKLRVQQRQIISRTPEFPATVRRTLYARKLYRAQNICQPETRSSYSSSTDVMVEEGGEGEARVFMLCRYPSLPPRPSASWPSTSTSDRQRSSGDVLLLTT